MTIAVVVIVAGVIVGLVIDVVLTRRHRADRVEPPATDAVSTPPAGRYGDRDDGVNILGPVEHEAPEVPSIEWDIEADPFHEDPFDRAEGTDPEP